MRRLFISDLHLETPTSPQFLRFAECLAAESRRVDEIYVLGDLVEMWIGDDDDNALAIALTSTLQLACKQCRIYLMHGNRDFLFGKQFANQTGVTIIDELHEPEAGLLLSHGDQLCTDDSDYQTLRAQLRGQKWQSEFLAKPLSERRAFGNALRQRSRHENANKAEAIMDANPYAIEQLMTTHKTQTLIHGHTHRPGLDTRSSGQQRIVLGAWEVCGWLCRQQDGVFELACFSLAHRYGT